MQTEQRHTDLSAYDNSWYNPGPRWKVLLWHFTNAFLFNSYTPVPARLKVSLLRLFGATVGQGVLIKPAVNIKYPWLLTIGDHVWIGEQVWIDNLTHVTIGNNVCLSQGAMLLTGNHDYQHTTFDLQVRPVVLEAGAWIGARATVCPGVRVKSHAVLAVGSIAARDLDAYTIYQGNPAVGRPATHDYCMTVSIITVVYNGADTIAEAIESVLGQSYPDIEYIIVDGASTDGTVEIVKRYGAQISRFISEPDNGLYDAMNKGIQTATGNVVGILNADDLYRHPDVISHVVDLFQQRPVDAVYGDLVYARRDRPSQVTRYWQAGVYKPGAFLHGWMPPHPTFFVRRTIYDALGTFNTSLRSAADYELMLRFIHRHQIRIAYLPEVLVTMRLGGVSNSSLQNRLRANREDRLAWQLNQLRPGLFTLWLKPLRKMTQFLPWVTRPLNNQL